MKWSLVLFLILCSMSVHAVTISNVEADPVTEHYARIIWDTDVGTKSRVMYGTTSAYGQEGLMWSSEDSNRQTHFMHLTGLAPGTTYHYCPYALDGNGNPEPCQQDYTFTTQTEPGNFPTPPEAPRVTVDTTFPTQTGNTYTVNAANCHDPNNGLQALIDNAQGGDTIVVPAGLKCYGTHYLRSRQASETGWIVITTDGALPSEGTRVTPNDAAQMPKIIGNVYQQLWGVNGIGTGCSNGGELKFALPSGGSYHRMYHCSADGGTWTAFTHTTGSGAPSGSCTPGNYYYDTSKSYTNTQYAWRCQGNSQYAPIDAHGYGAGRQGTLVVENGAHHYRLVGIELTNLDEPTNTAHPGLLTGQDYRFPGTWYAYIINIKNNAHHIVFDRSYIHGNDYPSRTLFGIQGSGSQLGIVDSYADEIAYWKPNSGGTESGSSFIYWGSTDIGEGIKIENNYIDTSGITIFADGGKHPGPTDMEITGNYIRSDERHFDGSAQSDGLYYDNRHRIEFKRGQRIVIDGNIVENSPAEVNWGSLILLSTRPAYSNQNEPRDADASVRDVNIKNNVLREATSAIYIYGHDNGNTGFPMPYKPGRISIANNLITDIDGYKWQAPGGWNGIAQRTGVVFEITSGVEDVNIEHNTVYDPKGHWANFLHHTAAARHNPDLRVMDNLLVQKQDASSLVFTQWQPSNGAVYYLWSGTQTLQGTQALNAAFQAGGQPDWKFQNNLIVWVPNSRATKESLGPANNQWVASESAAGMNNAGSYDFSLAQGSTYKNTASDGTDPGVDWAVIQEVIDEVSSGVIDTSTSPGSITVGSLSVTEGSSVSVPVTRTGGSAGTARVDYATETGGTASTTDYTPKSGQVEWVDGEMGVKYITIQTTEDSTVENDETINIRLSNAIGASISNDLGTVTITDNDVPPPQLLAHYEFEGSGTTATDSAGNNDGVIAGGASRVSGKYGNGIRFDGVDDVVNVVIQDAGFEPYTFMAWINQDFNDIDDVVALGGSSTTGTRIGSYRNRAFVIQPASIQNGKWETATGTITQNNWHHIAVVFDHSSASNYPVFYIDGVQQGQIADNVTPSGTPVTTKTHMAIGARPGSQNNAFTGIIDDVRIYDQPMSGAQIFAVYNNTNTSTPPPPPPPPQETEEDINGDGTVDVLDLVQYINDMETNTAEDINSDGNTNILDLMLIVNAFS